MVAVALVAFREDFDLSVKDVTWVVTAFYISSAAGQPLMGRLADRFGPRRLFTWGMCVVLAGSAAAVVAPTWTLLCGCRVLIALGTATAFPCAVAVLDRHVEPEQRTSRLAGLQLSNNIGASVGPVVGGLILLTGTWRPLFMASIPVAAASLVGVVTRVPRDPFSTRAPLRVAVADSDVPGVALFVVMLVAGMLSATGSFPVSSVAGGVLALVAAGGFVLREQRSRQPFLDLRTLARNAGLMKVYASWLLLCGLYYLVMFGMPQLLQDDFDMSSGTVGLLIAPIAVFAAVVNRLAFRVVATRGVPWVAVLGCGLSAVTCAACAAITLDASVWIVLVASSLLGISSGILMVALAQGMYLSATPDTVGVAAGLFQTSRYFGALAAAAVIGVVFGARATPHGWLVALVLATVGCVAAGGLCRSWTSGRPQSVESSPR
jgi:MFS family permease